MSHPQKNIFAEKKKHLVATSIEFYFQPNKIKNKK